MVYGYVRVRDTGHESFGNTIEDQTNSIKNSYPDANIIVDISPVSKIRERFTGIISSMKEDDILCVTSLDRICRTAYEGMGYIKQLRDKNAFIHILNMGIIDNSSSGTQVLTILLSIIL